MSQKNNLASTTDDLWVEVFEDFVDLPEFTFEGSEEVILQNDDLKVSFQVVGHYAIYQIDYAMMPSHHPEKYSYLVYDIDELEQHRRKVFKIFDRNQNEITLGEATYDIGLLFSGGRVFSDTHFIAAKYRH